LKKELSKEGNEKDDFLEKEESVWSVCHDRINSQRNIREIEKVETETKKILERKNREVPQNRTTLQTDYDSK